MPQTMTVYQKLSASLEKQGAIPSLGRWLSLLAHGDLMALSLLTLRNKEDRSLFPVVRWLMSAEGLRSRNEDMIRTCTKRLGWHALAEFAYRNDWALISRNPSLTEDARQTMTLTPLGAVMIQALGKESQIARLLASCAKNNRHG